jgi:hypothetical protein
MLKGTRSQCTLLCIVHFYYANTMPNTTSNTSSSTATHIFYKWHYMNLALVSFKISLVLCRSQIYKTKKMKFCLFMCLAIQLYRDSHENVCSHISVFTYIMESGIMQIIIHSCLTLFSCGNHFGSQVFLHQRSVCPFMCIQSITTVSFAMSSAVFVIVDLDGFCMYFLRWQPSS